MFKILFLNNLESVKNELDHGVFVPAVREHYAPQQVIKGASSNSGAFKLL
jgi:hypothetical protein